MGQSTSKDALDRVCFVLINFCWTWGLPFRLCHRKLILHLQVVINLRHTQLQIQGLCLLPLSRLRPLLAQICAGPMHAAAVSLS